MAFSRFQVRNFHFGDGFAVGSSDGPKFYQVLDGTPEFLLQLFLTDQRLDSPVILIPNTDQFFLHIRIRKRVKTVEKLCDQIHIEHDNPGKCLWEIRPDPFMDLIQQITDPLKDPSLTRVNNQNPTLHIIGLHHIFPDDDK